MVKKYLIKWGNKTENIYTIWKAVSHKGAKERRKLPLSLLCLKHKGFSYRQLTGAQSSCSRAKNPAKKIWM